MDPTREPMRYVFRIYGTGEPIDDTDHTYIGTCMMGRMVWHVFREH